MNLEKAVSKMAILVAAIMFGCNTSETATQAKVTEASQEGTERFNEQHRPQFHLSPPSKWMNDPNGMVYYKGEYHLFYQHNPGGTTWGPMHWGHAVSKDMVNWEHLPIALYPDSLGTIFSGSAVVDENNTSGLGTKENPPMVAIFTYHNATLEKAGRNDFQTQGMAYSLDRGRTWKKYEHNPVIKNPGIRDFRDPKVAWNEEAGQWVMTLAVLDHIEFYGSKNLIDWTKLSEFGKNSGAHGGVWECPDLFPLTINGKQKWVLLVSLNPGAPNGGSGTQYFIGDFDGETFKSDNPENTTLWLDYGTDNYAGVTFSNVPASDGRRLFMGWMSNWLYANEVPSVSWRNAMTLPRELSLIQEKPGVRLISTPIKELKKLRTNTVDIKAQPVEGTFNIGDRYNLKSPLKELNLNLDVSQAQDVILRFSNSLGEYIDIGYSNNKKELFIDRAKAGKIDFKETFPGRHSAPLTLENGKLKLHIFLDVTSVEVFANDGRAVMTDLFFPNEDFTKVELLSTGKVALQESKAYQLKSIWK